MQVTLPASTYVTFRESARSRVQVDQHVSAVEAVEAPVFLFLRSRSNHTTEGGGQKCL